MQIYHPQHGILNLTDKSEIDRLLDSGGEVFNVHDKPWQRKNEANEASEANKEAEILNVPKRGRPPLSKPYTEMMGENITLTEVKNGNN